ncbi:MAG: ATP-binding protein, partial [Pseudomonadota bacterium]
LRYVLVICIVGFQLFTALAVVFLVYFTMDRAILQQSKELLDRHAEATEERISNFFLPSLQVSEMLAKFVTSGMMDLAENDTLERIFYGALRTSPEVSGLYFGRADGSFIYVFQSDGTKRLTTKWIETPGQGATYLVRDESYRPIGRYGDSDDLYDPRDRQWYISAAQAGTPTWTTPYPFYTSGETGVTFAVPVYNDDVLMGVFGADIETSKLESILVNANHGAQIRTSLLSDTGRVIVHISGGEGSDAQTVADMTAYDADIAQRLLTEYADTQQGFATQYDDGLPDENRALVLANLRPLEQENLPWLIATHATRDALSGGLLANQTRALWAAVVLLAVLSLFSFPLADRIRKPVLNFAEQSRDMVLASTRTQPPAALRVPYAELRTTGETLQDQISKRRNFEIQYDRTFNVSQRGMARIDPKRMRFLRVNKRLCEILGRPESVLLNCRLDSVLAGDKKQILDKFSQAVMSDRDFTIEADFNRTGLPPVPLRMTAFLMRDFDGQPDHAFAVFDNNEESKQSAARLENFKRDVDRIGRINLMGQFAAGLAHELNQPLGALVHDVDSAKCVLSQTHIDTAELTEILGDIDGHAHRAGDIIRALRNMIERDDQALLQFSLDELLQQTLAIMRTEAAAYDVDIQISVPANITIEGNRVQMAQVLVNLIRNAISALATTQQAERVIRLEAEQRADDIMLSVEDNGPGFPSHIRPFAQFETTSRTGLGLGLSISKSLVEANKGAIVHLDGKERGARFEITLPANASKRGTEMNERSTDSVRS